MDYCLWWAMIALKVAIALVLLYAPIILLDYRRELRRVFA